MHAKQPLKEYRVDRELKRDLNERRFKSYQSTIHHNNMGGSISLVFMQLSAKFYKIISLRPHLWDWRPHLGNPESAIDHNT